MQEAMDEVQMVVEGVYSAKAARKLAEKYEVSMPIVEQINEVLFENKSAAQAVDELMLRESKVSIPCCRGRMRQYSFFNSREQSRNNPLCFCIDWYQQNKGYFYGCISGIQGYESKNQRGNLYWSCRSGSDRQVNIYQAVHGSSRAAEYDG